MDGKVENDPKKCIDGFWVQKQFSTKEKNNCNPTLLSIAITIVVIFGNCKVVCSIQFKDFVEQVFV